MITRTPLVSAATGCCTYGPGKGKAEMIPGWPYSSALEEGRTSWTRLLNARRIGSADDATLVTVTQIRDLIAARWTRPGFTMTVIRTS